MKQLLAIAFIVILALSQYARQFNYLECKLANSFKPTTERCECERSSTEDKFAQQEFPSPKTHVHLSFDEFYTITGNPFFHNVHLINQAKPVLFNSGDECPGCIPGLYRPPCI